MDRRNFVKLIALASTTWPSIVAGKERKELGAITQTDEPVELADNSWEDSADKYLQQMRISFQDAKTGAKFNTYFCMLASLERTSSGAVIKCTEDFKVEVQDDLLFCGLEAMVPEVMAKLTGREWMGVDVGKVPISMQKGSDFTITYSDHRIMTIDL